MLLKKYTSNWIHQFTAIQQLLENELKGIAITIEHVGSTAVPNLDAKPIIDIDIIYPEQKCFEDIKTRLLHLGYYHNGNQGIEDRDVFKRTGRLHHEVLDTIKHHLYVCPMGSNALERHILSRNFLRKNDWARLQYQQMKYELAEKANQDQKKYAALKECKVNDFIDTIISKEKHSKDCLF
jgi:GrpB-like predicted nucleotidyltransferase (UPF0157 family)